MTARTIMKMNVVEAVPVADGIILYTLRHPWREHLPDPAPGAHVDLRLPDGKVRQYSLCGDPADTTCYKIAVKREDGGRGGSKWVHENFVVGCVAHVSMPRNNFGLVPDAKRFILIAGGIGVTPLAAMARQLAARGDDFMLHLAARTEDAAPLLSDLQATCGDRLKTYFGGQPRFDAAATLGAPQAGTHIYCCGPQRLTDAVRDAAAQWPDEQVHFEAFTATLDENFNPEPFDIRIASTGETIRIPANRSALDVLRERGFVLPSSCELGVCGSCECGYRDGVVIHRDQVLKVAARQDRMMLCVSRARVGVTLDL